MTKVTINNYKDATYKKSLTLEERNNLVSNTVLKIIGLYENNVYGLNEYTINMSFIVCCTNIRFGAKASIETKWKFINTTDVMSLIKNAIGSEVFKSINEEINNGLKYRLSTNPDTKELINEITRLIKTYKNTTDLFSALSNISPALSGNQE